MSKRPGNVGIVLTHDIEVHSETSSSQRMSLSLQSTTRIDNIFSPILKRM